MKLHDKRVLVVGLGRSGRAAARLCLQRGAQVTLTDHRAMEQLASPLDELAQRCTLELGGHQLASFCGADLVVLSPGVPALPELDAAHSHGVPIIGEIELAARFVHGPIVGITGTNGKSTTTQLVGDMLAESACSVFCGGNLGQPLSELVEQRESPADRVVVVELSSFQLETVERFHAHIALLLNLSQDHLDRYPDYAAYQQAKKRLFEGQSAADFVIVSGEPDQADARTLAASSAASQLRFAVDRAGTLDAWREGDSLYVRLPASRAESKPVEAYSRASLRVPGQHNTLNALAALITARLAGATVEGCRRALRDFVGLPHRMQLVGRRADVSYYDDSKATNVGAVVGSLSGFEQPVVLIAGGTDKGGDYAPLAAVVRQVCRHVVLIGAAADRMQAALVDAAPIDHARTLPEAVERAASAARAGDAVVLSPACSSFDMFRNFEHRGRVFAEAATRLTHG